MVNNRQGSRTDIRYFEHIKQRSWDIGDRFLVFSYVAGIQILDYFIRDRLTDTGQGMQLVLFMHYSDIIGQFIEDPACFAVSEDFEKIIAFELKGIGKTLENCDEF